MGIACRDISKWLGHLLEMLPLITSQEEFSKIDTRNVCFLEAARAIFTKLGVSAEASGDLSFPSNGSLPVVLARVSALKFFPPIFPDALENEISALLFLSNQPALAPQLLDTGSFEDWHYVLMGRLQGQCLKAQWDNLSTDQRQEACRQVGRSLRQVHGLPVPKTLSLASADSWKSFLKTQTAGCYARHEKIGLREDLLQQIPSFLQSVKLDDEGPCFLHTEVMRDHVFFTDHGGQLSFQGFIDFEPSMTGAAEYDFASVGVFLSSGNPAALKAFFKGYGCLDRAAQPDFKRRVMAYLLLHKYSNLKWYLQFMPDAKSLDELAELWWSIGE